MSVPYLRQPTPSTAEAALQLDWAFGLNNDYRATVHNLSTGVKQRSVFYAVAHIGILYDAVSNTQRHLLGHRYSIVASSCCAHNHRFIVTADEGDAEVRHAAQQATVLLESTKVRGTNDPDVDLDEADMETQVRVDPAAACKEEEEDGARMIIWDAVTALPLKVIATGKYGGVLSVAMSPDGQYLATLNRRDPQEIMIWSWTQRGANSRSPSSEEDPFADTQMAPVFVRRIAARDEQTAISFCAENPELLCCNGTRRVTFWSWSEGALRYYSPPILQRRLKASLANFTHTVYLPGTTMACSGTVDGDVVLWALQPQDRVMKVQDKTLIKVVRVHTGGVTALTTVRGYIVTGGIDGVVKFMDAKLRLVAWFDDLGAGPIVSISFDRVPPISSIDEVRHTAPGDVEAHLLSDGTTAATMFTAPDFMVATAHGMLLDVPAKSFHTAGSRTGHGKSGTAPVAKGRLLVQGQDRSIECLAAHPHLPRLAICGYSGHLHLWDYCERRVLCLSLFRNLLLRSMAFDPSGRWLVVGCTNGVLKFLNAETLAEEQTIRPTSTTTAGAATTTVVADDAVSQAGTSVRGVAGNGGSVKGAKGISDGSSGSAAAAAAVARRSPASIELIAFSADSRLMATAAADGRVGLYEYTTTLSTTTNTTSFAAAAASGSKRAWQLIGHHKTHKEAVCGLSFMTSDGAAEEAVRLLSVGTDKRLIEYNLVDSSPELGLLLRTAHKIVQESVPTGFVWLPRGCPLLDRASQPRDFYAEMGQLLLEEGDEAFHNTNNNKNSGESGDGGGGGRTSLSNNGVNFLGITARPAPVRDNAFDSLLITTSEYKLKTYLSNWSRQCIKTVLAPTYGGPLSKMAVVPLHASIPGAYAGGKGNVFDNAPEGSHCLLYATGEKVIGLCQLPLRGDPSASVGLLAHPGPITSMVVSHDGAFAFTAGGPDQSVMQWRIDGRRILPPAEAAVVARCTDKGGVPLRHLVEAVEGGEGGALMTEVVDYFYYAQIRAQGEETTAKRVLLGAIPFAQLPSLLRSLGYYPSEQEIGHMTYEVANMYGPHDEPLADVDVDAILLDFSQFMRVYINYRPVFGVSRQDIEQAFETLGAEAVTGEVARDVLFQLLATKGEPLQLSEISAALSSLLGPGVQVDMLEDVITARGFAENLLGFEDYAERQPGEEEEAGDVDSTSEEEDDAGVGDEEEKNSFAGSGGEEVAVAEESSGENSELLGEAAPEAVALSS